MTLQQIKDMLYSAHIGSQKLGNEERAGAYAWALVLLDRVDLNTELMEAHNNGYDHGYADAKETYA